MADKLAPLDLQRKCISPSIRETTPEVMRGQRRWTPWRLVQKRPGEKPAKLPRYKSSEPETWVTFEQALAEAEADGFNGIGYHIGPGETPTPVVVIDIDKCIVDGKLTLWAEGLVATLPGFYWERGPSGNGLHGFGLAHPDLTRDSNGVPEIYTGEGGRYITVTGDLFKPLPEKLTAPSGQGLAALKARLPQRDRVQPLDLPLPDLAPVQDWRALLTGAPLKELPKAAREGLAATTAAGEGERSKRIWATVNALLGKGYPADRVYQICLSAPGVWLSCMGKRGDDEDKAAALLWSDILRAGAAAKSQAEKAELQKSEWDHFQLAMETVNGKLVIPYTPYNTRAVIEHHPLIAKYLKMDVRTGELVWENRVGPDVMTDVGELVRTVCGWKSAPPNDWLGGPVLNVAEKNKVNLRADALRLLRWDGEARLDSWLTDHVASPEYLEQPELQTLYRQMGRMFLVGYVARIMDPGCKFDTVPIFIGTEGAGKNKLVTALAGGIDRVRSVDSFASKDDLIVMAQAEIVELSETHAIQSKHTTNNQLKGFITRQVDTYRAPYAARPISVARGFVLVSTANSMAVFHSSQDGLRRFWPIHVKDRIAVEWVEQNRDQLIAEAVNAYLSGEKYWFEGTPPGLRTLHAGDTKFDPLEEKIEDLAEAQKGKGALTWEEVVEKLECHMAQPNYVAALLEKHGVKKSRLGPTENRSRVWGAAVWGRPKPKLAPSEQAAKVHGASVRPDIDDVDPLS